MIQKFYSKLSDKEKKIFYLAVAAIVLALFDSLFLRPVQSRLKNVDEEITAKKSNIKRARRILAYHNQIMSNRDELAPYYSKEEQSPDQIKAAFLQKIEMLATEAKINLSKVAPSGEEESEGFRKYFAELECSGRLEDLILFIHKIDTTQELLKVVKMNLTGKAAVMEISANMTVMKMIPDPQAVATAAELKRKEVLGGAPGGGDVSSTGQAALMGKQAGGAQPKIPSSGRTGDETGREGPDPGAEGPGGDTPEGAETGEESAKKTADEQKARSKPASLTEWWNQLWGIKPKPATGQEQQEQNVNWQEVEADAEKKNLWERMLKKPQK